MIKMANKALHLTAIPLRSIAASELGRYAPTFPDVSRQRFELQKTTSAPYKQKKNDS